MASGLTTVVTADITDIQTKLAAARSSYTAHSAELRKMADAARKAGEDLSTSLNPRVAQVSAQVAQAKIAVRSLTDELDGKLDPAVKKHTKSQKDMQGIIGQNRVAFNELTHTARAVADGLAAGINPMTLFSEEFFRVSQAITEFNTISIGTIARFGAIAAAIAAAAAAVGLYLEHLSRLRVEADLGTRLQALGSPIATAQIHEMGAELRIAGHTIAEMGDNSAEARNKIVASFADIKFGGAAMAKALADILPDFAHAFGEQAPEAVGHLTRDLNDLSGSGEKTMEALHLSTAQLAEFQKAASENPKQAMILYLDTVKSRLDAMSQSMDNARQTTRNLTTLWDDLSSGNLFRLQRPGGAGSDGASVEQRRQQQTIARNQQSSQDINAATAALPDNIAPDLGAIDIGKAAIRERELMSRTSEQIEADQAAYIKNILDTKRMGASERLALERQYGEMEVGVVASTSGEELKTIEINARRAAAAAGAARKDEVEAELATLRQGLADTKLTADARKDLQEQIAQLEIRDVRATAAETKKTTEEQWHDYSATMEDAIARAKGNYAEQIKDAQAWVKEGQTLFGQAVHNYENAQQRLDTLVNEQDETLKKAAEELDKARKDLAEGVAIGAGSGSKSSIGEFKASLKLVFDPSALDAQVSAQVSALRAKLDGELAALQANAAAGLAQGTPQGAAQAANDYKTMQSDMQEFADQAQAINQRAAQAVAESWSKIVQPIGNAFDSITSAVIKGGRNERQEVDRALEGILESYIKSTVKMVANWGAMELQKTFLTDAGEAARQAAQTPAEAQQIAALAKQLAAVIANQTAQTSAVATGTAVRAATTAAGAAAGKSAEAAAAGPTILSAAAKAAAGTYASVAQIPYVGWLLAPPAAAVAFSAVAAYQTVASAEGGWDNVPYDGAPAILHKNEMVLPANLAQGVREMTKNGLSLPKQGNMSALAGSGSVVNASGDTSHTLNLNNTTNIHASGSGMSVADMARAASASHEELHNTAKSWYGNNSVSLPGKRTWGRKG